MNELVSKTPILGPAAMRLRRYLRRKRHIYRLKHLNKADGIRLVIGSSGIYDDGWVHTDIDYLDLLKAEDWQRYFMPDSIDAILAEHVWEHLTAEQGLEAARRCFEYLKPGGYLRVAVPDGLHPAREYIESVEPGGTGLGAEDHKVLYDHVLFSRLFENAGFRVSRLEYFDTDGQFHFTEWSTDEGTVSRSSRYDWRNIDGDLNYTSIILDAHKDA